MPEGRPLILSASRRTDLPGFHASVCAERIRGRVARLRTRKLGGVVFWTRHLKPFLPGGLLHALVASEIENPVINLTVTGLGKTALEPGAPSTEQALDELPGLVEAFRGEPWRIRWRFDPLVKRFSSIDRFWEIGSRMAGHGVFTCTFSFPAYRSLKGDLAAQFEAAGIPRWEPSEKAAFLSEMADAADRLGIALLSCAQPENTALEPRVKPASCIPADILQRGLPDGPVLDTGFDRSQRAHCRCIESEDIGDYEKDRCLGGCAYCYSKAGGPTARASRT